MVKNTLASTLPSVTKRRAKRLGRGHGSGKVKTSGRGTKGQNARGKMPLGFEGGQLPLIKRLPLLRGKGKNKSQKNEVVHINISQLEKLPAKTEVTLKNLKKYALISDRSGKCKLLAGGTPSRIYTVKISCSKSAQRLIEKAGGSVDNQNE